MSNVFDPILLKETIIFSGTEAQLYAKIGSNAKNTFKIERMGPLKFKFEAKNSMGTFHVYGMPNLDKNITGYATLTTLGASETRIELSTKVRIELYFFFIVMMGFYLLAYISDRDIPIYLYFVLPLGLWWFWFIYRIQEKRLFNAVKKCLQ